ncbi:adhesion G protein-coupled receptor L1 [Trichonephila clavipes]|nr:adhesion G protein-coupled receptor L1 [Trichonephila clavipes]
MCMFQQVTLLNAMRVRMAEWSKALRSGRSPLLWAWVCQITSAILQYCVLCAFFWMLLEGILLYKMVIMVFETKKVRSIFLYFTAYGIPFVIVTLSSAMYPDAMIRQKYCWPSKEKGLIWSVLGPVLLIIVVNLIIFIMTLNAAARIDKINSTSLTCEGRKKNLNSCQVIYSQFGLAIHQNDHQARRRFVEWAQNEIAVVPDFHKRILFSDEAHFWLNGYVNKQNCRIWSEANSQVYVETPLHPEKLTVWCALWAGGILLQKR